MLQHRARGFAAKDAFPDALYGLLSEEEARGVQEVIATPIPAEQVKNPGKGMGGLEKSLGINDEAIIEAEIIETTETVELITTKKEFEDGI